MLEWGKKSRKVTKNTKKITPNGRQRGLKRERAKARKEGN
jgi:hypothetical protein